MVCMVKVPSENDVIKSIEKATQRLEGLEAQKVRADELIEQIKKIEFQKIKDAIKAAEKAKIEADKEKNYTSVYKNLDEAFKLIKESEHNLTDGQLKWGWITQFILGIIAFYIIFFVLNVVPKWVYLWGILGAVAYIVFSISFHYKNKELYPIQRLAFTARLIQSPILAGAIYLVLKDIGSTQQLIYTINQTLAQGANITSNITYPNITTTITNPTISFVSDNTLMAVSFLVGFFTEAAVGFLRSLSKKLLTEQPPSR